MSAETLPSLQVYSQIPTRMKLAVKVSCLSVVLVPLGANTMCLYMQRRGHIFQEMISTPDRTYDSRLMVPLVLPRRPRQGARNETDLRRER
jgi:hypothetical protein